MSSIPSAFYVSAAYNADARQRGASKLELEVAFDDKQARTVASTFDGYERIFALVPRETTSGVQWDRVDLSYVGSTTRHASLRTVDVHRGAATGVDLAAISQHGFAVGAELNGQTVWAQSGGGGNYSAYPSLLVEV